MITALRVRDFKRFADTSFDLRPLTVLTGLNGTGKSTAIQALLLARQAARLPGTGVVQLNGPYGLALGEADEIRHRDSAAPDIEVALTSDGHPTRCTYRFEVPDDRALHLRIAEEDQSCVELSGPERTFTYLCAERLGPRDQLQVSAELPDLIGVGVQGEYTAQVLAQNESKRVDEGRRHPDTSSTHQVTTLRTQVEMWASDIIRPIRITAQWPLGITASTIRFQESGSYGLSEPIRPANMGFGFSYALPIIVAGLLAEPGDTFVVENPEAHLHPGGQSRLGRFLARVAASGMQVIVETHSDHVVNGMRLAVAEERVLEPDAVIVHYFGDNEAGPVTIDVTPRGEFTTWPTGFFDQIEKDLGGLARARRKGR